VWIMGQCDDIRDRLWDLVDGDLPEPQRGEVEGHLAVCENCRRELALRRRLWGLLEADTVPEPPDLTQRILNRVAAVNRQRTHARWLRWGHVAAVAACLAIALSLILVLRPTHQAVAPPSFEPAYLETQLVDVQRLSDIELLYFSDLIESVVGEELPGDEI
jgi:anti-sigma factor (TIGR02949 family)